MKRHVLQIAMVLCICLLACGLATKASAAEVVDSGSCGAQGENATWTLDRAGTLTISGSGKMADCIGNDAPWAGNSVKVAIIKKGVTHIGMSAFSKCPNLSCVYIPDSITDIAEYAFSGCTSLTAVHITDVASWCETSFGSVEANPLIYANRLYLNNVLLTDVVIPEGVKRIEKYAFYGCRSLNRVSIPSGVTDIGQWAFYECISLSSVDMPSSITSIGDYAFSGCSKLDAVHITDLPAWCNIQFKSASANPLYNANKLYPNDTLVTDLVVPNTVTTISPYAFINCTNFIHITIPNTVTSIGNAAFRGCTALNNIVIPSSVTSIDRDTFSRCSSLTNISIPNSVTSIGYSAFSYCSSLTSITIPDSVVKIQSNAFSACYALKYVIFEGAAPSIGDSAFYQATLYYIEGKDSWTTPLYLGYPTATWDGIHIPHDHDYVSVVTDPTCTEQGYTTYTCSICDDSYTGDYVDALGHDWSEGKVITEATCTEEGSVALTCTRCAATATGPLSPLGHSWDTPVYTWSTNHASILASHTCTRDTSHVETESGQITFWVTREATIDREGEITYTATFENPAFATQTEVVAIPKLTPPEPTQNPFTDVSANAYYYTPVLWAVSNEITSGTSATTFSPDAGCTRAQVVAFLWRAAGKPEPKQSSNPFADVRDGQYYYKAVLWAVEHGITAGTSATTFSPDATCTRGQIVSFLWRYEGKPAANASNPFTDVKPGAYYEPAVLWAVANGVTAGTSATTFSPDATCTRAQVVSFLYRDLTK